MERHELVRIIKLEEENRLLRWFLSALLAKAGGEVRITSVELATYESDDTIHVDQDPMDKSWTVRRDSGLDGPDEGENG